MYTQQAGPAPSGGGPGGGGGPAHRSHSPRPVPIIATVDSANAGNATPSIAFLIDT